MRLSIVAFVILSFALGSSAEAGCGLFGKKKTKLTAYSSCKSNVPQAKTKIKFFAARGC